MINKNIFIELEVFQYNCSIYIIQSDLIIVINWVCFMYLWKGE